MFTKSLWLFPLLCLSLAQPANEEKAKKDLQQMQGTWIMHALEINGKEVPPQQIQDTYLTVKRDVYQTKTKKKEHDGLRLKLDPSKNPKAVDMIKTAPGGAEEVIKGIYLIEKDTLKICRGLSPEHERPNQFATWPNTNAFVVTWKKESK